MVASPRGIEARTLMAIAAIAVAAVLVVGLAGFVAVSSLAGGFRADADAATADLDGGPTRTDLTAAADALRTEIDEFMTGRVEYATTLAAESSFADAAASGSVLADELALTGLTAAELDERFAATGRLPGNGAAHDLLGEEVATADHILGALVTDDAGRVVATSAPGTPILQDEQRWWLEAWESGTFVGGLERDTDSGLLTTDVAARIDVDGRPAGVIHTRVDLTAVETLTEGAAASTGTALTVSGGTGMISSAATDADGESGAVPTAPADGVATAGGTVTEWVTSAAPDTDAAESTAARLGRLGDDASSAADDITLVLALVIVAVIVGVLVLAFVAARLVVRPLQSLRDATTEVSNHHLPRLLSALRRGDEELPAVHDIALADRDDDIGEVAEAFNRVQAGSIRLAADIAHLSTIETDRLGPESQRPVWPDIFSPVEPTTASLAIESWLTVADTGASAAAVTALADSLRRESADEARQGEEDVATSAPAGGADTDH